ESLALSVVAVLLSLALAVGVWLGRWPRLVLLAVLGFGLVFTAGDGREVVHQLDESNNGLAAVAAVLIGLHVAVAGLAVLLRLRALQHVRLPRRNVALRDRRSRLGGNRAQALPRPPLSSAYVLAAMTVVSRDEARRIAVRSQLLDDSATGVLDAVRRLGFLQL